MLGDMYPDSTQSSVKLLAEMDGSIKYVDVNTGMCFWQFKPPSRFALAPEVAAVHATDRVISAYSEAHGEMLSLSHHNAYMQLSKSVFVDRYDSSFYAIENPTFGWSVDPASVSYPLLPSGQELPKKCPEYALSLSLSLSLSSLTLL